MLERISIHWRTERNDAREWVVGLELAADQVEFGPRMYAVTVGLWRWCAIAWLEVKP